MCIVSVLHWDQRQCEIMLYACDCDYSQMVFWTAMLMWLFIQYSVCMDQKWKESWHVHILLIFKLSFHSGMKRGLWHVVDIEKGKAFKVLKIQRSLNLWLTFFPPPWSSFCNFTKLSCFVFFPVEIYTFMVQISD